MEEREFVDQGYEAAPEGMTGGSVLVRDDFFGNINNLESFVDNSLNEIFSRNIRPKASELKAWAEAQGWTSVQTANGPLTYIDENGIKRITIKQGSNRTVGSEKPHIEVRNAENKRIDPRTGDLVSKRSSGNHVEIDFDL